MTSLPYRKPGADPPPYDPEKESLTVILGDLYDLSERVCRDSYTIRGSLTVAGAILLAGFGLTRAILTLAEATARSRGPARGDGGPW